MSRILLPLTFALAGAAAGLLLTLFFTDLLAGADTPARPTLGASVMAGIALVWLLPALGFFVGMRRANLPKIAAAALAMVLLHGIGLIVSATVLNPMFDYAFIPVGVLLSADLAALLALAVSGNLTGNG